MTNHTGEFRVEPAGPLFGDVEVGGSKNAVTKHMVAALLGSTPSEVRNAPDNRDVEITAGMLRSLGVHVEVARGRVALDPTGQIAPRVPLRYTGLNRIPILMIGPLLHRVGEAFVPLVGGDNIGTRPVNFHVDALVQMGAEIEHTDEGIEARAKRLRGARITLPFPSVMATETVLLAAVMAEGRTVIENAATEPEVVELALFLQRMGALVELKTDRRFIVEGVERLNGASQRLGGDRIEAVSYLIAGLATHGRIRVFGCGQDRIASAVTVLQKMGAQFQMNDHWLAASAELLRPVAVRAEPHPGFMTDWHPPLVVLMTQASGMSVMHETVFEDRFVYVDALRRMGAEIEVFDKCLVDEACRYHQSQFNHSAVVRGPTPLVGTEIEANDIRASFANIIAAAAADGASILGLADRFGEIQLERGYDRPIEKFAELGLKISPV